jgi:hypothetical protein
MLFQKEEYMFKLKALFALVMMIFIIGAAAIAGDKQSGQASSQSEMEMPPMGAPEQMKMLSDLAGTWDVVQNWKMDLSDTAWQTSKGVSVYKNILDGCAMQFTFESEMLGMPFQGQGLIAYNRETGKWQTTWIDNMGATIGYYTGDFKDGKFVVSGEDKWNGQTFLSRITTYNMTPGKFDWMYEMSMDGGKTWAKTVTASYTKR